MSGPRHPALDRVLIRVAADDVDEYDLKAYLDGEAFIGEVLTMIDGPKMLLCEIKVAEEWRCRGLGSLLLERVIEQARTRRCTVICGHVVQRDATPKLLNWYRRRGFSVGDPDASCGPLPGDNTIHTVRMSLLPD